MSMEQDLIYDVGLHNGADTRYYLAQGFRVVAVDANPSFIEHVSGELAAAAAAGRLRLVHAAIQLRDGDTVPLYLSNRSDWHSLDRRIAERDVPALEVVPVPARRLDSLFAEYGTPVYCKIDIEGADPLALESLNTARGDLPKFVSCEAECAATERWSDAQSLHTLDLMIALGYTRFKLVDQVSLRVLPPGAKFYGERWQGADGLVKRLGWRASQWWNPDSRYRMRLRQRHGFEFENDVTGPWGDQLEGEWVDADTARRMFLRHRRDYFARPSFTAASFWVDWHAMLA